MNLTDDLQAWLAQGTVVPAVLPQVIAELREIAEALVAHRGVCSLATICRDSYYAFNRE